MTADGQQTLLFVVDRVDLSPQGRKRSSGQVSAFAFQRWLASWHDRPDVRVMVAHDRSHAIAVTDYTAESTA